MKRLFTVTLVFVFSITTAAHSNEEIEQELLALLDEIEKYSSYKADYSDEQEQRLAEANRMFKTRLLEHTSRHHATLGYSFFKLAEKMQIETSPDGNLRAYSWDTLTGGTMRMYENVYQFRGKEGVYSTGSFYEEGDAGSFANDIFNVNTDDGAVYLIASTAVLSSSYRGQSIAAFRIDGIELVKGIKIFKTASGSTGSIGFGYDFFSVVDRSERPIRLFKYDEKTKAIMFPVVIEDDKTPQGRVTSSQIIYKFDGRHFIRMQN